MSYEATAKFHERVAAAYRSVGKDSDAQSAERAALIARRSAQDGLVFKVRGKKLFYAVQSVADAVQKWNEYRTRCLMTGAGPAEFGYGGIVRSGNRIVAKIAYNGRTDL